MNNKLRIFLFIAMIGILGGSALAFFIWNKPRRNVEDEKGIGITASLLVKEYQQNEAEANKKFWIKRSRSQVMLAMLKITRTEKLLSC